jgi:hypothetical protein
VAVGALARWTISCRCGATEARIAGSERGAAAQVHGAGWRAVDDRWLCPECAAARYRRIGSSLRPPDGPLARQGPDLRTTPPAPPPARPPRPRKPKPRNAKPRRPRPPTKVELAERALLANPDADLAALARELDCHRETAGQARKRLIERGEIPPRTSKIELAERALLADPTADPGQLAAVLGCGRHIVYDARRRLRARGAPGF